MKQILQNLNSGETVIEDIPCPKLSNGQLLIRTSKTLVSAGTERMLVDFGKANLIDKARQQPDKVKMVIDKVKTDGVIPTYESVKNKLDQPLPLGYCNIGTVMEVADNVVQFKVGDRVISNGKHAEVVSVPENLCCHVPASVSDEEAAFTVLGSIALQGIRLIQPTLGEAVVVTGLGLIGLVTVQLLRAHGCRVLGIDFDQEKLEIARQLGAETVDLSKDDNPISAAEAFSRGRGVDAVIITASTKSNDPVHQAALMCRQRGRIVLVGVVGLELSRADFYEKELSFQVSCSYGPGRYDPLYEEGGQDYPIGFVRWTEQRNFEAVLDMIADNRINVKPLISHRFPLENAKQAYELVGSGGPSLGIILEYANTEIHSDAQLRQQTINFKQAVAKTTSPNQPVLGFIGSGNYATSVLIPAFEKTQARLKSVASSSGISSVHVGKKHGFQETTTDSNTIMTDSDINTIVITTRHDSHANFVCQALEHGKHVFVEKPLSLDREGLANIETAYTTDNNASSPLIMVGFNRRFAPQVIKIKSLLEGVNEPKSFIMTVNAGSIPADHWTQDMNIGGRRIIGEGCHFIDLLRFLAGSPIVSVQAMMVGESSGIAIRDDRVTFSMQFSDGSFGTVHYLANGDKSFPKERLEVFCAGKILQLDNFRKLNGFGWPGFKKLNLMRQDKGNAACAAAFIQAIKEGKPSPIPFDELVEVTNTSFDIMDILYNK
jgi:predicted dehydrogenase/threonine dehydrogenase-like Zn-dependent dehydrogenase